MKRNQSQMINTIDERLAALNSESAFKFVPEIGFSNGQGVVFNVVSRSDAELCVGSFTLRLPIEMEKDDKGNSGIYVYFDKVESWQIDGKSEQDISLVEKKAIRVAMEKAIVATGNYFDGDSD